MDFQCTILTLGTDFPRFVTLSGSNHIRNADEMNSHRAGLYPHTRHRDHVAGLPIIEHHIAQTGPGAPETVSIIACGLDIIVGRALLEPKLTLHMVLHRDWLFFMLPLSWKGDYIFNGNVASPNDMFVAPTGNGYATVSEMRDNIGFGIRKRRLKSVMRHLSGRGDDSFPLHDQRVALNEAQGRSLRCQFLLAIEASRAKPLSPGRCLLSEVLENDLICSVANVLLAHSADSTPEVRGHISSLEVIRAAQLAYTAKPPHLVSLEDLCSAAGVGQAWLHKCFVEIYGIPPMGFLRAYRLREARSRILDTVSPPRSIKEVALALGFFNGGRFAADYRALFSENPAETLARNVQPMHS